MTLSERKKLYFENEENPPKNIPMCCNCKHYHQHYVRMDYDKQYIPLKSGHCGYPRLKCRNAYDICEHFQQKGQADGVNQ